MAFTPTSNQIERLYKQPPFSAVLNLDLEEVEKFAFAFEICSDLLKWMWNSRENKTAALRVVTQCPKGLILYRAYFYGRNTYELLFNNSFEAVHIYWLCRLFNLGEFPDDKVRNKETAAGVLIDHLNKIRNEKISFNRQTNTTSSPARS